MIHFFRTQQKDVIATQANHTLSDAEIKALCWLYGDASYLKETHLEGHFIGPRREMVTPWSTNAVEITQNMGLNGIWRIEKFYIVSTPDTSYDAMLQRMYNELNQDVFSTSLTSQPIRRVDDLHKFNGEESLALSKEEIAYLENIEQQNGRPLTEF